MITLLIAAAAFALRTRVNIGFWCKAVGRVNTQRILARHSSSFTSTICKLECSFAHILVVHLMMLHKRTQINSTQRCHLLLTNCSHPRSLVQFARTSGTFHRYPNFQPRSPERHVDRDRQTTVSSAVVRVHDSHIRRANYWIERGNQSRTNWQWLPDGRSFRRNANQPLPVKVKQATLA